MKSRKTFRSLNSIAATLIFWICECSKCLRWAKQQMNQQQITRNQLILSIDKRPLNRSKIIHTNQKSAPKAYAAGWAPCNFQLDNLRE